MNRYAIIYGARDGNEVASYLPANYRVIHDTLLVEDGKARSVVVIQGQDNAGWTLNDYVIPRLASGLLPAHEIDLSHPVMREVPA